MHFQYISLYMCYQMIMKMWLRIKLICFAVTLQHPIHFIFGFKIFIYRRLRRSSSVFYILRFSDPIGHSGSKHFKLIYSISPEKLAWEVMKITLPIFPVCENVSVLNVDFPDAEVAA